MATALLHGAGVRWAVALLFEPRDLWVGVFWEHPHYEGPDRWFTFYVCLIPMLPLRCDVRLSSLVDA